MKLEKSEAVDARKTAGGEIASPQYHKRQKSEDQPTKPAPGRLPMHKGQPGRVASIFGVILIVMGIVSLAYFASPLRLMLRETIGQSRINFVLPILGGLALISGIALLLSVRQRTSKKKTEL